MRWYILANGEAKRWNNYLGVEKPLISIDGETLLSRIVRILRENNQSDIVIIGKYEIVGAKNYIPAFLNTKHEMFKDIGELSYDVDSFVILNGDCYYTEAIVKDVINRTVEKWLHWCCQRPNKFTGKPWEEGYAHKITDVNWWTNKMTEYCDKVSKGEINHISDWCINRYLIGIDLYIHQPELMKEFDIDWEDETDDFDFPVDYDRWMKNVKGIDI